MGYGVIGSPTGSGPVSLGSSPGTPAEADSLLIGRWPIRRGPAAPGGTHPHPAGAGFSADWPLANFAGGPQCFPGGRPPGGADSRLVGWGPSAWFRPCLVPYGSEGLLARPVVSAETLPVSTGDPAGAPPASQQTQQGSVALIRSPAPTPTSGPHPRRPRRHHAVHRQRRHHAIHRQRRAPRHTPATHQRWISSASLSAENAPRKPNARGVAGDSPVGRSAGGSGGSGGRKGHPRPRRGGYEDGDVWVAPGLALWLVPRPWGPMAASEPSVPRSAGWSARGLVRGLAGPGSWRRRLRLTQGRRPARGADEGGGHAAGRPVFPRVTSGAGGNVRVRHP